MASAKVVLAIEIWQDIRRHILTYTLMALVVLSAFAVVYFTHLNRQTTSELEQLLSQRDELDIEWRNLLLEQNSLAEHSSIESKAGKLLNMKRPNIESEVIIELP
ncbi:cell division protein FtsL [Endozoicomonas sp. G2_1]|uniref:cell division protein FtsL n=1 Tax=Endozoicomonas sp. G2_1 TaxID=2821091 RepID=UPI001ADD4936|nr:cell division protein FtsL [Endozoicomonas sp. G2_1]MBO9491072.1 cell division protein FtsL [Endozoicomonas sp. G2_1]